MFDAASLPVEVRADEYPLEDALAHLLQNGDRFRGPGTPIVLTLTADATSASIAVRNVGPAIPADALERIFEHGDSTRPDAEAAHRGQGLFVARTYLAKMGGTLVAQNRADGVEFLLTLQRAPS